MILGELSELFSRDRPLETFHVGFVTDNVDPLRLGRVKLRIPNLLEFAPELTPWFTPVSSVWFGGSNVSRSLWVPDLEDQLVVVFPSRDIYSGFYIGVIPTVPMDNACLANDDYPNIYGFHDPSGALLRVNKVTGKFEYEHPSGTKIIIAEDGAMTVDIKGNLSLSISGNVSLSVDGSVDSIVNMESRTQVNGASNAVFSDVRKVSVEGLDSLAVSQRRTSVSLTDELSIGGYRAVSIIGNDNVIVGGSVETNSPPTGSSPVPPIASSPADAPDVEKPESEVCEFIERVPPPGLEE